MLLKIQPSDMLGCVCWYILTDVWKDFWMFFALCFVILLCNINNEMHTLFKLMP